MKRKRVSMLKYREIIRLNHLGISQRDISLSVKVARSTVQECLKRVKAKGLDWEKVCGLSESELGDILKVSGDRIRNRQEPDYEEITRELRYKSVTLKLLWEEYIRRYPDGYGLSNFCLLYRRWKEKSQVVLHWQHKAGESMMVDYAGQTVRIKDCNGKESKAQVFVSVLPASNLIYAEVTASQGLSDWIESHKKAFRYFGGVPKTAIIDNLKSGVTNPCYYEPDINRTYQSFAEHYAMVVLPARVRKPRDKGKVESAVQIVERSILAKLRHREFSRIEEANAAVKELLEELNNRKMQAYGVSRRELFNEIEKDKLRDIPKAEFVCKEVVLAKVHIDYHISFKKNFYSVPHQFIRHEVEVHANNNVVDIYNKGAIIASHPRSYKQNNYSTLKDHMPPNHNAVIDYSFEAFIRWSKSIGVETESTVAKLLSSREYPQQAYRACLGFQRLEKTYSSEKLEKACKIANQGTTISYRLIANILSNENNFKDEIIIENTTKVLMHENVRGKEYFH